MYSLQGLWVQLKHWTTLGHPFFKNVIQGLCMRYAYSITKRWVWMERYQFSVGQKTSSVNWLPMWIFRGKAQFQKPICWVLILFFKGRSSSSLLKWHLSSVLPGEFKEMHTRESFLLVLSMGSTALVFYFLLCRWHQICNLHSFRPLFTVWLRAGSFEVLRQSQVLCWEFVASSPWI